MAEPAGDVDLTDEEKELLSNITLYARPTEITSADEAQRTTLEIQEHMDRFVCELNKLELPRTEIEFRIREEKVRVAKIRLEKAKFAQREVTIYWGGDAISDCENIMLENTTDLLITASLDAWTVCRQVACKNGLELEKPWGLIIYDGSLSLLRTVEDHEKVAEILDSWKARNLTSRQLFFRLEPKKYHVFDSPAAYFSEIGKDIPTTWTRAERKLTACRKFLTQYYRQTPAKVPTLTGDVHIRVGLKKWKKVQCTLSEEGLSFERPKEKTPGTYATFSHTKFFETVNYDRLFKAPSSAVIAIDEDSNKEEYMKAICFEDRFSHVTWYMALRMGTFRSQLLENFELNNRRIQMLESLKRHGKSFAAKAGRRATNLLGRVESVAPVEITLERGADFHLDWSHRSAEWFHGKISRIQQKTCLEQLGGQDGLFLIRESTTQDGQIVLVLCHKGSILNFLIREEDSGYAVAESGNYPKIQLMIDALKEDAHGLPCCLTDHAPKILSFVLSGLTVDKVTEDADLQQAS